MPSIAVRCSEKLPGLQAIIRDQHPVFDQSYIWRAVWFRRMGFYYDPTKFVLASLT